MVLSGAPVKLKHLQTKLHRELQKARHQLHEYKRKAEKYLKRYEAQSDYNEKLQWKPELDRCGETHKVKHAGEFKRNICGK